MNSIKREITKLKKNLKEREIELQAMNDTLNKIIQAIGVKDEENTR